MKTIKNLLLAVGLLAVSVTASASVITISEAGTFTDGNDFAIRGFSSALNFNLTVETTSYETGGFDPIITVLDSTGSRIAFNDDSVEVNYGSLDSGIFDLSLIAGTYSVVITQFANLPANFLELFTLSGASPTFNGNTGDYAYDITISTVPVPAAGILFASALLGAGFLGRRKKKVTKSNMIGAFARAA